MRKIVLIGFEIFFVTRLQKGFLMLSRILQNFYILNLIDLQDNCPENNICELEVKILYDCDF